MEAVKKQISALVIDVSLYKFLDRWIISPISLWLIRFYQKYISPRKGYRCAYSVEYGGPGCSGAVKSIISEHGLFSGWPLIQERFDNCRDANEKRKKRRVGCDASSRANVCVDCGDIGCDSDVIRSTTYLKPCEHADRCDIFGTIRPATHFKSCENSGKCNACDNVGECHLDTPCDCGSCDGIGDCGSCDFSL